MIPYAKTFTIRWADCDVNGHVRNTSYSEYAIDVRMAYLAEHGFGWERMAEAGIGPVLTREEIDYVRELKLGDRVTVDFQQLGASPDGTRFRLAHDFARADGKPVARIVLEGGWLDLRTRRLTPPPPALAKALGSVPKAEGYAVLPERKKGR